MYVRSYIFITHFPNFSFRHWWLKLETHEKPTKTHKNGISRKPLVRSYGNYAQKLHTMPLSDRGNFLRIKNIQFWENRFFVSKMWLIWPNLLHTCWSLCSERPTMPFRKQKSLVKVFKSLKRKKEKFWSSFFEKLATAKNNCLLMKKERQKSLVKLFKSLL